MTDYSPAYLDEPYPLDHTITWREHFARKQERIDYEDRMYEKHGPEWDEDRWYRKRGY